MRAPLDLYKIEGEAEEGSDLQCWSRSRNVARPVADYDSKVHSFLPLLLCHAYSAELVERLSMKCSWPTWRPITTTRRDGPDEDVLLCASGGVWTLSTGRAGSILPSRLSVPTFTL